eukprot:gene7391-7457_t
MPLVPAASIAGRALVIVVAIMTFLAALTAGGAILVAHASQDWRGSVAREMTIQVRQIAGRDVDVAAAKAGDIARQLPGIGDVKVYTRAESERLLEPWLGTGLDLGELPVPRLIVVKLGDSGIKPDLDSLRQTLNKEVPGSSLDDHAIWLDRLVVMANSIVIIALVIFALVVIAMVMAVAFATRGAMAGNREIIDVLHMVGAADAFIADQFQRHFMGLGLKGGLIGAVAGALAFALAGILTSIWAATPGGDQVESLFGTFSLGLTGYAAILMIGLALAMVTGLMSRMIVFRFVGFVRTAKSFEGQSFMKMAVADGVAVLTGGQDRLSEGVEVLASGHARRLLISGVNPNTSASDLAHDVPKFKTYSECCIDLGYTAQNTIGNAEETRDWMRRHHFESLIVVTSSYHMPRALAELRHVMPGTLLIPHVALADGTRSDVYLMSSDDFRLYFVEYIKFLVAHLRFLLVPVEALSSNGVNKVAAV